MIISDDTDVLRESNLIGWLERGVSIAQMAEEWGVSAPTIHYHLRRMGFVYSRTQGWRRRNGTD